MDKVYAIDDSDTISKFEDDVDATEEQDNFDAEKALPCAPSMEAISKKGKSKSFLAKAKSSFRINMHISI